LTGRTLGHSVVTALSPLDPRALEGVTVPIVDPAPGAEVRLPRSTSPNVDLTFDGFVAGVSNVLTEKAAESFVAGYTNYEQSRLVLTGATGAGKTHLLHAIAHGFGHKHPRLRVGLFPMVEVVGYMIDTIPVPGQGCGGAKLLIEFDVLLIDDLDRDSSKPQTWIELMHLLDKAHHQGLGVVATGHHPHMPAWSEVHRLSPPDARARAQLAAMEAERAGLPELLPLLRESTDQPAASVGELRARLGQLTARARLLGSE
jgi:chromosomal replication initiation ATPase DnaA